jgi:hypothetical protein
MRASSPHRNAGGKPGARVSTFEFGVRAYTQVEAPGFSPVIRRSSADGPLGQPLGPVYAVLEIGQRRPTNRRIHDAVDKRHAEYIREKPVQRSLVAKS